MLKSPYLKPKDMLILDMGYMDGENISIMKLKRKVDIPNLPNESPCFTRKYVL